MSSRAPPHRRTTVRVLGDVRDRVTRAIDILRAAIRSGGGDAHPTRPGHTVARLPDGTHVAIHVRAVDPATERARLRAFYVQRGHPIPEHLQEDHDAETE